MKNKYTLMKILLVLLVFVIAGVIYSCASGSKKDVVINDTGNEQALTDNNGAETENNPTMASEEVETSISVCIHVCGAVKNPGVYYLDQGSRVHQAVELAGGLKEDAAEEYINLADIIIDGMQVYIPTDDEVSESGKYTLPTLKNQDDSDLVDINKAGADELAKLPGIGESKAEAIIAYRENVMPFESPQDIVNVSGIGESLYEKIKDNIKV